MKKRILSLFIVILVTLTGCYTQNLVTVRSANDDISENLDLEAVAALFGESTNLEDFEARINDPQNHISNLDLNGDGYVDYIRVVESMENGVYLITLQDVLGHDQYQDIATIDVGRNTEGYVLVEIVGDPYFYGPNYIIQPIYNTRPVIYSIFWNPYHRFWVSPYYWNYYPHYFQPWRPYTIVNYRSYISRYRMAPQYYRYMHARTYNYGDRFNNKIFRNDYEKMHPNRGFEHRNQGYQNARELYQKRNNFNNNVGRQNTPEHREAPNRDVKQQPVRVNKEAPKYREAPVTREKSPVYNKERP
ncbi:MAG: hypothetical protein IH595_04775, partial [Bacteroidales bacterium]|nr:hypothetical protein [Bacteroidales bacterium]